MNTARKSDGAELPDGWRMVMLGDIAEVRKGQSFTSSDLVVGGVPVIAGGTSPAYYHAHSNREAHTITISASGANAGFVAFHDSPILATDCNTISASETAESITFIYQVLKYRQRSLFDRRSGSAQPHVYPQDVRSLPILLPPLFEQHAVASVLDSIDEAIERTEAVIAATETLRDALLHELLTRGVPGWHTEWKDVPGIGTIPANWDVVRLGEVATVRNGTTPSRKHEPYWDNGDVPFVKTGRVNDVFIREPDEFITLQAVKNAGAVMVPEGSILIAMIGQGKTRGMTARLGFSAAINQNFAAVYEPSLGFDLDYFFSWASHNYVRIRGLGQGSNQDALNCELIQRMQFPVPPISEQQVIVGLLEGVAKSFAEAKKEQGSLQSLKHSTADTLLTGRTRLENRNE